jgi:hypothetical protein
MYCAQNSASASIWQAPYMYQRQSTVAIAVRRKLFHKTLSLALLCSICTWKKLERADRTPEHSCMESSGSSAAQITDETYLFDCKSMMPHWCGANYCNRQNGEYFKTTCGNEPWKNKMESNQSMTAKCKGSKETFFGKSWITVSATTDSWDRCPEDAAQQNALVFILHQEKAQNSGPDRPEHSCTE